MKSPTGKIRTLFAATLGLCMFAATPGEAQSPTAGFNSPWRNSDGSNKLALEFGGGFDTAAGATRQDQERGWNFEMGGGYNFNRRLGTLLEYHFDHAQIPQGILKVSYPGDYPPYGPGGPSGNVHLWSVTAEPIIHYFNTEHFGAYLIGGGGFYRKLTTINSSVDSFYCREYFPLVQPCIAAPGARFSNNAGGLNLGTGMAWRLTDSSNVKFFIEARYVWVDNQPSPHNLIYPPANSRTGNLPVSGGLRW